MVSRGTLQPKTASESFIARILTIAVLVYSKMSLE